MNKKRYKKIISFILTIILVYPITYVHVNATDKTGAVARIGNQEYTSLKSAFAAAPTNNTETEIVLINDAIIGSADIVSMQEGQNVVLIDDGTARTIRRAADNVATRLITMNGACKLTLRATSQDDENPTLIFDGQNVGLNRGSGGQLIAVGAKKTDAAGKLIMESGVALQNNISSFGGAVLVSGTFDMRGGVIRGNKSIISGGGLAIFDNGTFNMSGGMITGNSCASTGGGVHVNPGSRTAFTMTGGEITGNTAGAKGGGVQLRAKASITGGKIIDNIAKTNSNEGNLRINVNTVTMGSEAIVDEIYLTSGKYLNISSELTKINSMQVTLGDGYDVGRTVVQGEGVVASCKKFSFPEGNENLYINQKGTIERLAYEDVNGANIEFRGGSLRMDYDDFDKTSLRFGYKIILPEGATLDSWSWSYTTTDPNYVFTGIGKKSTVNEDGSINANLVITGIPRNYYNLVLTSKMKIRYTLSDGTECMLEETIVRERSVNIVAESILASEEATQAEKNYATNIYK